METLKIRTNSIISFYIVLIAVSHVGIFAGYRGNLLLFSGLLALFFVGFLTNTVRIGKNGNYSTLWISLLFFLCLSATMNVPRSFYYIILFCGGILIVLRKIQMVDIKIIFMMIRFLSAILAISVFIQAYFPSMFYPFARIWFSYSNQYDLLYNLGMVSYQYSGLFYEVNASAVVLSIGCIVFFVYSIFLRKGKIKNLFFSSVLYFAIVLTGKRSLILIVPVYLAAFWFIHSLKKTTRWNILILTGVIIILVWKFESIWKLLVKILSKGEPQSGIQLSSRERFWSLALNMFLDSPILGKGINSYDIAFNKSGIRDIIYDFAGTHNSYFQLLAETGIVGTVLYMSSIFSILFLGIKKIFFYYKNYSLYKLTYNSIATLSLCVLMSHGLSENVLHQPQQAILIFLFCGMILNINKIRNNDFYDDDFERPRLIDDELALMVRRK